MKKFKIILITVIALIVICVGYVTTDCVRLRYSESGTKPIITTDTYMTENRRIYKGIGYSVGYYENPVIQYGDAEEDEDIKESYCGAEFRLFDKILVWAWIE